MADTLDALVDEIQSEARREDLSVDEAVYRSAEKDPTRPILCAGALDAPICVVGRDLGRDEVKLGQPLVGAGGSLVRRGVLRAWGHEDLAAGGKPELAEALRYVLLTNTVPYKPPGNKAYPEAVKERFRPFLCELLTRHWKGTHILTLGTEAFRWFEPYGDPARFLEEGRNDLRFEEVFRCEIPGSGASPNRPVFVMPLPHPSPLNRRWVSAFPEMLSGRLRQVRRHISS